MTKILSVAQNLGIKRILPPFIEVGNSSIPQGLSEIIAKLEEAPNSEQALKILAEACQAAKLKATAGNFYENENAFICNLFRREGALMDAKLKKFDTLKLGILPSSVKTIYLDGDAYVIGKYNCANPNELLPYIKQYKTVPKEQKLAAYKNVQALTKKGITSDDMIRNLDAWKVSSSDNKIFLDPRISVRPVAKGENKDILEKVYNILFIR